MRKEFKMTDEQYQKIMTACMPVTYMVFGGVPPKSRQENANDAWVDLGDELGFKYLTVQPVQGKDSKYITAETQ